MLVLCRIKVVCLAISFDSIFEIFWILTPGWNPDEIPERICQEIMSLSWDYPHNKLIRLLRLGSKLVYSRRDARGNQILFHNFFWAFLLLSPLRHQKIDFSYGQLTLSVIIWRTLFSLNVDLTFKWPLSISRT